MSNKVIDIIAGIVVCFLSAGLLIYSNVHAHKVMDKAAEDQYYASATCDICGQPTAGKSIYQIEGNAGLFGRNGTSLVVYDRDSASPEKLGDKRTAFICEDCIGKINVNLSGENITKITADGKTLDVVTILDGGNSIDTAGFCTECGAPYTGGDKFCSSCGTALITE